MSLLSCWRFLLNLTWQIRDITMECKSLLQKTNSTIIYFARQEANSVAHSIAQYSLHERLQFESVFSHGVSAQSYRGFN